MTDVTTRLNRKLVHLALAVIGNDPGLLIVVLLKFGSVNVHPGVTKAGVVDAVKHEANEVAHDAEGPRNGHEGGVVLHLIKTCHAQRQQDEVLQEGQQEEQDLVGFDGYMGHEEIDLIE